MSICISLVLNYMALLISFLSSKGRSKKNHDLSANKDRVKAIVWGSPAKKKKSKQFGPASSTNLGNTLTFFPL